MIPSRSHWGEGRAVCRDKSSARAGTLNNPKPKTSKAHIPPESVSLLFIAGFVGREGRRQTRTVNFSLEWPHCDLMSEWDCKMRPAKGNLRFAVRREAFDLGLVSLCVVFFIELLGNGEQPLINGELARIIGKLLKQAPVV